MKQILFLNLFILINIPSTFSQNTITLDFKTKEFTPVINGIKLKKGDKLNLVIKNFNPLLYKVSINTKDSTVATPIDAGFLGMFLNPDKLSNVVGSLINSFDVPSKEKEETESEKKVFNRKIMLNNLENKGIKLYKNSVIDNYFKDVLYKINTINLLRDQIDETTMKAIIYKDSFFLGETNFNNETEIINRANHFKNEMLNYSKQIKKLKLSTSQSYIEAKLAFEDIVDTIVLKSDILKIKIIDSLYKLTSSELISMDTVLSIKNIGNAYESITKFSQYNSDYISLPIFIKDDAKAIDISILPVSNTALPIFQTSIALPLYQSQIWGVSGGIFFSGLQNKKYQYKPNATGYNLIEDKQSKMQMGVNSLAYTAWRIGNNPNYVGLSFGAGMSLENKPKPRILIGPNFITGDKNKILFTLGYIGGYVTELSDVYSTSTNYSATTTNYQKDVIRGSFFLSINYSFINK